MVGSGLVERYSGCIPVLDDTDARFYVHEYRRGRLFRRTRRYMLDTGEAVRRIDSKRFEIMNTGELLVVAEEDEGEVAQAPPAR
jgi:hypothetical protein